MTEDTAMEPAIEPSSVTDELPPITNTIGRASCIRMDDATRTLSIVVQSSHPALKGLEGELIVTASFDVPWK